MELLIKEQLYLITTNRPLIDDLKKHLTYSNPEYSKALRMGIPVWKIPFKYECFKKWDLGLIVPRGTVDSVLAFAKKYGEKVRVKDYRVNNRPIDVHIKSQLSPFWYQENAIEAIMARERGMIIAPCGCLDGDTEIIVNRGGKSYRTPIEKLYRSWNGLNKDRSLNKSIPTKVRSYNGSRVQLHTINNVVYSGIKICYKITLEDNTTLIGTYDHKIMTDNGWVQLGDCLDKMIMLDTLRPIKLSTKKCKIGDKRIGGLLYHPFAREQNIGTSSYTKLIEYHRAVVEADLNNLELNSYISVLRNDPILAKELKFIDPSVYHIHHIDGNHFNNNINNLTVMTVKDHLYEHSKEQKFNFNQGVVKFRKCINIECVGDRNTYDISCDEPYHNFVANNIVVHNSGKTCIAVLAINLIGQSALIVVHTTELFNQWKKEINTHLGGKFTHGIIGGGKKIIGDITVATVQTLSKFTKKEWLDFRKRFSVVILDECFHERVNVTLGDGSLMPIGKIVNQKLPVMVKCFNIETKEWENKKVVNFYKKKRVGELVRVCLFNNTTRDSVICTPNHKFYTGRGYVKAIDLVNTDFVFHNIDSRCRNSLTPDLSEVQLQLVYGSLLGDGSIDHRKNVARVRLTHGYKQYDYLFDKCRILNIQDKIVSLKSGYTGRKNIFQATTLSYREIFDIKNQPPEVIFSKLDRFGLAILFGDNGSCNGDCISLHTERYSKETNEKIKELFFDKFKIVATVNAYKSYFYLKFNVENSFKLAELLNDFIHPNVSYKLGRFASINDFWNDDNIKKLSQFKEYCTRYVGKVAPFESNHRRYDYVYNIEVEDNHNYLANGFLVSNSHHAGANSYVFVMENLQPRYLIGLTATLKRRDKKDFLVENYLGEPIYTITDSDLEDAGRTVDCKVTMCRTGCEYNYTKLGKDHTKLATKYASDLKRNKFIVDQLSKDIDSGRLPMVLVERKASASILVNLLEEKGYKVAEITGNVDRIVRDKIRDDMSNGKYQVLVANKAIAAEGLNIPCIDTVHIAFYTTYTGLIKQMIGRGRRVFKDKEYCKVVFYVDDILESEVDEFTFEERIKISLSFKTGYASVSKWFRSQGFIVTEL